MSLLPKLDYILSLNWRNAFFRLWIAMSVCWEAGALLGITKHGFHRFDLIKIAYPFLFLIGSILLIRLAKWIIVGLKNDGNTGKIFQSMLDFLTITKISKVIKYFCLNNSKISLKVFSASFIFILLALSLFLGQRAHVSNELPNLPKGFVLDKNIPIPPPGFIIDQK